MEIVIRWSKHRIGFHTDIKKMYNTVQLRQEYYIGRNTIPFHLTRRQCVSKVTEVFEITGKITPITATMKFDLHTLVERGLSWDNRTPDDLKPTWIASSKWCKKLVRLNQAYCCTRRCCESEHKYNWCRWS